MSLTPIAHYGGPNTNPYQATGWYAQGSAMTGPTSTCSAACKTLWQFPADPSTSSYNQNQKLLPTTTTGVTTFTPTGPFGLFSGGGTDVNFSDDGLNVGHQTTGAVLPVPHYLHDMRIYQAYGPGHVAIPNTYIVGIDLSRVPAYKNNDYQDVVLLLRNAQPAVAQATVVNATNDIADLTAGGSVSTTCAVTGFDGIMANTAGTQCNSANMSFDSNGLTLTSTPGQLASGTQENASTSRSTPPRSRSPLLRGCRPGHVPDERLPADRCVLRARPEELPQSRGRAQRLRRAAPDDVPRHQRRVRHRRHGRRP